MVSRRPVSQWGVRGSVPSLTQINATEGAMPHQTRMDEPPSGPDPDGADRRAEHGGNKYQRVLAMARHLPPVITAVVHPCDAVSLAGAVEAHRLGLISPILVGPSARLAELAREHRIDIAGLPVVASAHSHDSAAKAVALV